MRSSALAAGRPPPRGGSRHSTCGRSPLHDIVRQELHAARHHAALTASSLPDRLADLLLRQARARRAPEWVVEALAGRSALEELGDARVRVVGEDGRQFEVEVRLVLPAVPAVGRGPWRPAGIDLEDAELARLSYVVVDEIVEDAADVSVSPWPEVDDRGRLVFADEPALSLRASVRALQRYLARAAFASTGSAPSLRMGDAFGARVRRGRLEAAEASARPLLRPSAWLVPPVYDVRSAARDKAKEAFYAAVSPTLAPADVEAIRAANRPG